MWQPQDREMQAGLWWETQRNETTCGVILRDRAASAYGWQTYHLHVPIVLKSGSLNLLEPSGSFTYRNVQHIGLHVKYPLFLLALNVAESSRHIFEKSSDTKFNQNPSRGDRTFSWGQKDGRKDIQTDIVEVIVPFHNFGNAPNIIP
jgi:hypothetical protein